MSLKKKLKTLDIEKKPRTQLKTRQNWKKIAITIFLVPNTHIWWTKAEYITTEMRFLLMFKIDAMRMSRERHSPEVTLGPL